MGTQEMHATNNQESDTLMRSEAQRLTTFRSWPHNDKVEARKIAKAGFFHTGNSDSEVKCLWCGTILNNWEYGDQVMARHRSANPECPFIRNISDNVPLLNDTPQVTSQSESEDNEDPIINSSQISQDEHDTSMEQDYQESHAIDTTTARSEGASVSSSSINPIDFDSDVPPDRPYVNSQQPLINFNLYRSESARLETYRRHPIWSHRFIQPADLANAGFVYLGNDDHVQCVFCEGIIGNWEDEDFPMTEHRLLYPACPFIRGLDVGNIPIQSSPSSSLGVPGASLNATPSPSRIDHSGLSDTLMETMGFDEVGIRPQRHSNSGAEKGPNHAVLNRPPQSQEKDGIIQHTGPANNKYSTPESRLRSFRDWPPALRQEPKQLSDAGFYYIGLSDQTKCFYCDGGLRNWQPDDDPWTEHARWFSKCGFVRLIKGDDFIKQCLDEKPPEPFRQDTDTRASQPCETCPTASQPPSAPGESRTHCSTPNSTMEHTPSTERSVSAPGSVQSSSSEPSATMTTEENTNPVNPDLEQENRRLKEARICKICMDSEVGVVFLPCGHLICCVNCAPSLKDCPMCRQPIHGTVKTYMS